MVLRFAQAPAVAAEALPVFLCVQLSFLSPGIRYLAHEYVRPAWIMHEFSRLEI
jgi:hypothetical protein